MKEKRGALPSVMGQGRIAENFFRRKLIQTVPQVAITTHGGTDGYRLKATRIAICRTSRVGQLPELSVSVKWKRQ